MQDSDSSCAVTTSGKHVHEINTPLYPFYIVKLGYAEAGPSSRFKKWSGGRYGRVPKARVGESTRGG